MCFAECLRIILRRNWYKCYTHGIFRVCVWCPMSSRLLLRVRGKGLFRYVKEIFDDHVVPYTVFNGGFMIPAEFGLEALHCLAYGGLAVYVVGDFPSKVVRNALCKDFSCGAQSASNRR